MKSGNATAMRSEEHTSELQSPDQLVCRLLLEKKKKEIVIDGLDKNNEHQGSPHLVAAGGGVGRRYRLLLRFVDRHARRDGHTYLLFFLMIRRPRRSTLFPYTTLFR